MKVSSISKIAGLGFAGFVVASIAVDKMNLGPVISQVAGAAGAVAGSLMARYNGSRNEKKIETKAATDTH